MNKFILIIIFSTFCRISFCQNNDEIKSILKENITKLKSSYDLNSKLFLIVYPPLQKMYLIKDYDIIDTYNISTSKYGIGCKANSNKTPYGTHIIKEKIGQGATLGTIFKQRKNTGEIAVIYKDKTDSELDYVTTRIMWLDGMNKGVNKGGNVDSYSRYIYIHGTPEEGLIGVPSSHGCIRMNNKEVIELFDRLDLNTIVHIIN